MLTINNTLDGYLKDVEIKGNTVQDASNLADIRSVGEKIEGQELYEIPVLSVGKNLFDGELEQGTYAYDGSSKSPISGEIRNVNPIYVKGGSTICFTSNISVGILVWEYNSLGVCELKSPSEVNMNVGFKLRENTEYINFRLGTSDENVVLQIEKGTVATPYEPYVEDKLTILSPVQLEKVGDVADRIIEKDGVWGVEKNVIDTIITGDESGVSLTTCADGVKKYFNLVKPGNIYNIKSGIQYYHITNKLQNGNPYNGIDNSFWLFFDGSNTQLRIRLDDSYTTKEQYIEWLKSNNILVKYITTQPQFIPLPHSQQVKLRTFANKTNISFLTEIEGTIKAQVPKSIGATVNTHTEQISNLNKELDRVKKLEESTVSTVTTESDFTTVEATNGGYFEDVKLEGKTLVNLVEYIPFSYSAKFSNIQFKKWRMLKPSTEYTFVLLGDFTNARDIFIGDNTATEVILPRGDYGQVFTFTTPSNINEFTKAMSIYVYKNNVDLTETQVAGWKLLILEGDHTQNPPSYFEGLKSVGDGVDEIVVSSVKGDGNLFDGEFERGGINFDTGIYYENNYRIRSKNFSRIDGDCYVSVVGELTTNPSNAILYYDSNKNYIGRIYLSNLKNVKLHKDARYFKLAIFEEGNIVVPLDIKIAIYKEIVSKPYTPHQSDKKRLLYYNDETQSWEKPILRQWDSIEKHADGKYYYHQRSGEVVLNGSESWSMNNITWGEGFSRYCTVIDSNIIKNDFSSVSSAICDKLIVTKQLNSKGVNGIHLIDNKINIVSNIENDLAGFKAWLQANNVTVVYQLAQEKVYECTNIDLITYSGETNFIVESGVLSPRTTLKVHNNISNVVSLLQKKVSLLESNMTSYMITQNRLQLSSTYSADSVTFKVDYAVCSENRSQENYNTDLYNLILNNIVVGKDNYDYDHMFNIIMDYASWSQISWDQFDILVGIMDLQHNPPIEPPIEEVPSETPEE